MTGPPPPAGPAEGPPPAPRPAESASPGSVADAWRATVGVVVAFGGVLLVAGLVGLLLDSRAAGPTAGAERAQLTFQAVGFCLVALLLAEGLRPAVRSARLPSSAQQRADDALTVVAVGVACALGAYLVGPLVAKLWPALEDRPTPVGDLGVGSGLGADLGTIVVVAGLVPLGEELLFRGVLTGVWLRAGRPVTAVVMSTVIFGLAHVTVGPRTMVIAALLGALLAGALLVSGSLGAVVLAHALVNGIALLEAGLAGAVEVGVLVVVIGAATAVASRLSPLVSWAAPAGTLQE